MFQWPPGFARIPDEEWTRAPVASLAKKYDAVGKHGWYENLDPTVEEVSAFLREGHTLVDYSGGTGLFLERLFAARPQLGFGALNVDSSPKFLAMSLEKLREEPRAAFRLLQYLREEKRLQRLDEVIDLPLDAIVSTNAIHLYHDLDETLRSWVRLLKPGARVFVQSGNIRNPDAPAGAWIIDDTVAALQPAAQRLVHERAEFARHRAVIHDTARMARHDEYRRRVFLPPRPLAYYLAAFERAGLRVASVRTHAVRARADEWHQFLSAYSDAVLGWVGGVEKIEGAPATQDDLDDRLHLMRLALGKLLAGRPAFEASWTYVTCERV